MNDATFRSIPQSEHSAPPAWMTSLSALYLSLKTAYHLHEWRHFPLYTSVWTQHTTSMKDITFRPIPQSDNSVPPAWMTSLSALYLSLKTEHHQHEWHHHLPLYTSVWKQRTTCMNDATFHSIPMSENRVSLARMAPLSALYLSLEWHHPLPALSASKSCAVVPRPRPPSCSYEQCNQRLSFFSSL